MAGRGFGARIIDDSIRLIDDFARRGINVHICSTSNSNQDTAFELTRRAVLDGFNRIVFVCGDGGINEGINGLASVGKLDLPIGVVPIGVGNNFAKNIGIPLDSREAIKVALGDCQSQVDVGVVNGRLFANAVSFGFDARITKVAIGTKKRYGFFPKDWIYLATAIKEMILGIKKYQVELQSGIFHFEGKVILVAVTNGESYGAIFKIAPGADPRDGMLNVCLIEPMGKLRAFANILKVIQGTHLGLPEVMTLKTSSLVISSPEKLICQVDGEVIDPKEEYRISVLPKALNLLVPRYPERKPVAIKTAEFQASPSG